MGESVLAHNFYWLADSEFLGRLWDRVKGLLPPTTGSGGIAGLNARFRGSFAASSLSIHRELTCLLFAFPVYRYIPGAIYRPHIDGAWPASGIDPTTGEYLYDSSPRDKPQWSRLTFLVSRFLFAPSLHFVDAQFYFRSSISTTRSLEGARPFSSPLQQRSPPTHPFSTPTPSSRLRDPLSSSLTATRKGVYSTRDLPLEKAEASTLLGLTCFITLDPETRQKLRLCDRFLSLLSFVIVLRLACFHAFFPTRTTFGGQRNCFRLDRKNIWIAKKVI